MGQRHRAITLDDGTVIFDVLGAAGDEDDNDDDSDDDDDDEDESEEDEDESEDDDDEDDDDKASSRKGPSRKKLTDDLATAQADARKYQRRLKAADRDKMRYKGELEKLQTGDKKDLADARSEIEKLKGQLAAASGQDKVSRIREEFLFSDAYKWRNRKTAFKLLDLDEVDVDKDGKVDRDSLKDAMDELVRENPYLLESTEDPKGSKRKPKDEDDEEERERPSGRQPKQRNRNRRPAQDRAKLEGTYPILVGR